MNDQREKYLTELMGQVEAYQLLLDNPGWQLFKRHVQARASEALKNMKLATTSDMLLKHTYEFLALRDLPEAPEQLFQHLSTKLNSALDKSQK